MEQIKIPLKIDISKDNTIPFKVTAFDNLFRALEITIVNDSEELNDYTGIRRIIAAFKKRDGKNVIQEIVIPENGQPILVPFQAQTLSSPGVIYGQISLFGENGEKIGTGKFVGSVGEDLMENAIASSNDWSNFQKAIYISDNADKWILAENKRCSSEEKRITAETSRVNAESLRVEAENLRELQEQNRQQVFNKSEINRTNTFVNSEKLRTSTFEKSENNRTLLFQNSETSRENLFNENESIRKAAETARDTKFKSMVASDTGVKTQVSETAKKLNSLELQLEEKTLQINNLNTNKVEKVVGKGLSTNDYNNTEKAEVAKVKDKLNTDDLLNKVYPVGSIYISTANTNPNTFIGGTWVKFAEGQTLIGTSSTDSDFFAGKTGGEKVHTLTEQEIPIVTPSGQFLSQSSGSKWAALSSGSNYGWDSVGSIGGGQPHNNLPPYIVVYMWTRTA